VCGLYHIHRDEGVSFLVEPQNQGRWFFLVWPQNRRRRVSRFEPQNWQLWFGDLSLKITAVVSWFGPQNQAGFDLSVVPQNRWRKDDAGHTLRSSGLLRLEASRARVFQSGLKTGRDRMAGNACGTITEVTSGSS
jgi:hypothetical protein